MDDNVALFKNDNAPVIKCQPGFCALRSMIDRSTGKSAVRLGVGDARGARGFCIGVLHLLSRHVSGSSVATNGPLMKTADYAHHHSSPVVAEYLAGVNAFDVDATVATFAPDAYVNDGATRSRASRLSGAGSRRRWSETT
jgi:hypothetical protein